MGALQTTFEYNMMVEKPKTKSEGSCKCPVWVLAMGDCMLYKLILCSHNVSIAFDRYSQVLILAMYQRKTRTSMVH